MGVAQPVSPCRRPPPDRDPAAAERMSDRIAMSNRPARSLYRCGYGPPAGEPISPTMITSSARIHIARPSDAASAASQIPSSAGNPHCRRPRDASRCAAEIRDLRGVVRAARRPLSPGDRAGVLLRFCRRDDGRRLLSVAGCLVVLLLDVSLFLVLVLRLWRLVTHCVPPVSSDWRLPTEMATTQSRAYPECCGRCAASGAARFSTARISGRFRLDAPVQSTRPRFIS